MYYDLTTSMYNETSLFAVVFYRHWHYDGMNRGI